ncbi:hypothetical protein [Neisseria dentiae]|nr:hypothetical protein [Neisseria dentiae]QMT44198.1 hypothetical protein H3L92_06775 [Neisseria dentiae]STZ52770.1 Uncharacterised protein [Neisseria dentiae]
MREEEYRAAGRLFESGYPDGGQTDRRLGGLLGLLANFDHLAAICLGMEEQILGRDSVPEPDIAFLLCCVVAAKQEAFRLYSVEHHHGEIGGELSLLNRIEEELLQYQADMHYLGIYPDNPPSNT